MSGLTNNSLRGERSGPGHTMNRTACTLCVEALDALLKGRMAEIAAARDWDLLREVAHLAQQDAPLELASTDPALYRTWRAAVTNAGARRCHSPAGHQSSTASSVL